MVSFLGLKATQPLNGMENKDDFKWENQEKNLIILHHLTLKR